MSAVAKVAEAGLRQAIKIFKSKKFTMDGLAKGAEAVMKAAKRAARGR